MARHSKDFKKDHWIYPNVDEGNTDGPSPHPETKQEQTALTSRDFVLEAQHVVSN